MSRKDIITAFKTGKSEQAAKLYFLEIASGILKKPMPEKCFEKFLAAGEQYGPFNPNQDWIAELESEVQDGVFYAFLDMHKRYLDSLGLLRAPKSGIILPAS